jgi:hypothetical protein
MQPSPIQAAGSEFPQLRENIWHINADHDKALLVTSDARFEVDTPDALKFVKMRSHCTGHHSIEEIARRSELTPPEVGAILSSLAEANVLLPQSTVRRPSAEEVRGVFQRVCEIWSEELRLSYVGNLVVQTPASPTVVIGWLLEMYHYISDFPAALQFAAERAQGALKPLLTKYAAEERGHEKFVLQTLVNLGLSPLEVTGSAPLVSTKAIAFLMRDLFECEPAAALLMAALVEAPDYDVAQIAAYKARMTELYGFPPETFDPYFAHQRVDFELGHARLLAENAHFLEVTEVERLDTIMDRLHDLKHGFDLQSLEISNYYGALNGKYFPRQKMRYAAI